MPIADHQKRHRPEGENGRDPQTDKEALLMAACEPQRDRQDERQKGGAENGQRGAETELASLQVRNS